jgi:hypothetical protein
MKKIRHVRHNTRGRRIPLLFAEQQLVHRLLTQLPFECLIEDGGEHGIEFSRGFQL